jgi:hypothetical protein
MWSLPECQMLPAAAIAAAWSASDDEPDTDRAGSPFSARAAFSAAPRPLTP